MYAHTNCFTYSILKKCVKYVECYANRTSVCLSINILSPVIICFSDVKDTSLPGPLNEIAEHIK